MAPATGFMQDMQESFKLFITTLVLNTIKLPVIFHLVSMEIQLRMCYNNEGHMNSISY